MFSNYMDSFCVNYLNFNQFIFNNTYATTMSFNKNKKFSQLFSLGD